MGQIFSLIFTYPITNVLLAFYALLIYLHVPNALGFSIILLTIFIRVLLYPFVTAQIKSQHKMQKVAGHVANIRDKHKSDKKRQQEEIMKLYKEHGVNPASGCLPLLIQLPVIWALYHVLTEIVGAGAKEIEKINDIAYFPFLEIHRMWNTSFFSLPLSTSPSKLLGDMPLILLIPLLTAALQFVYSKMLLPEEPVKRKKDDFQSAFQTQSLIFFPLFIGYLSFAFPLGLALYWNTFTLFGILQQYSLVGPGGLKPWVEKVRKNG